MKTYLKKYFLHIEILESTGFPFCSSFPFSTVILLRIPMPLFKGSTSCPWRKPTSHQSQPETPGAGKGLSQAFTCVKSFHSTIAHVLLERSKDWNRPFVKELNILLTRNERQDFQKHQHGTKIAFFKAKGSLPLTLTGGGLGELGLTMSPFENPRQGGETRRLRRLPEEAVH